MRLFWSRAFLNWEALSYDINGEFADTRGGNEAIVSPDWFSQNVQNNHGPLGRMYPNALHYFEGDSPAFLHLIAGGLCDPEHPEWGGWGGRCHNGPGVHAGESGEGFPGTGITLFLKDQMHVETSLRAARGVSRFLFFLVLAVSLAQARPRVIVLTDIGGDPDDQQSLVRFLAYSCEFDVEGLIACTSNWKRGGLLPQHIHSIIDAYAQVRANLLKHNPDYPAAELLHGLVMNGQPAYGMDAVGDGKSTVGSNRIIARVDADDPRPLWLLMWGGGNTFAQALWDVRKSRTSDEVDAFMSKVRAIDVSGQDDAGAWASVEFNGHEGREKRLFWLRMSEASKSLGYEIKGELEYSRGGNEEVVSPAWFRENVQENHGPLGAMFPNTLHKPEGDTPSFLYLLQNGLSDPMQPAYGSWGGRFEWMEMKRLNWPKRTLDVDPKYWVNEESYSPFWMYNEVDDHWEYNGRSYENAYCTYFRWREAYQNDFAARMDWCVKDHANANHNPIAVLNGDKTTNVLHFEAPVGAGFSLDAAGTSDPDGNRLSYSWWVYPEPGTYAGTVTMDDASSSRATVHVPPDAIGKTIHVILEVTDDGSPTLYSYRRAVITGRQRGWPAFERHVIAEGWGSRLGQTEVADIDGDGDLDFFIGCKYSETDWNPETNPEVSDVRWYENPGRIGGRWIAHPMGDGDTDVGATAFDVEGDGDIDFVAGAVLFLNDGKGNFSRHTNIGLNGLSCHDLIHADIDGDGKDDVVLNSDKQGLFWYSVPGNPASPWERHTISNDRLHSGVDPAGAADFDGDGAIDIAHVHGIYENQGGGRSWLKHRLDGIGRSQIWNLHGVKSFAADINNDGRIDLVQSECDLFDGKIGWHENKGGWKFVFHEIASQKQQDWHSLVVADFDNDGDLDVHSGGGPLSGDRSPPTYDHPKRFYIWENADGRGGTWKEHVLGDWPCDEGVAADFDGDGDIDILEKPWRATNQIYIMENKLM